MILGSNSDTPREDRYSGNCQKTFSKLDLFDPRKYWSACSRGFNGDAVLLQSALRFIKLLPGEKRQTFL
jgi:hypothetical protein